MPRKFDLRFISHTDGGRAEECLVRFDARKYDPELVRAFLEGLEHYVGGLSDRLEQTVLGAPMRSPL
jgi:hypothetical protein